MLVCSVTPGLASVSISVFSFESGDGILGFWLFRRFSGKMRPLQLLIGQVLGVCVSVFVLCNVSLWLCLLMIITHQCFLNQLK